MKLKINIEQQKEISKIRKIIEEHSKIQDKALEEIAKSMGLDPRDCGDKYEILWDYVYNDSEWMVELEQ